RGEAGRQVLYEPRGVDSDLVVRRAERLRDQVRILELVARLPAGRLESDRERLELAGPEPCEQADDEARIDSAGKEHADRHVGRHAALDGLTERLEHLRLQRRELGLGLAVTLERRRPVALR